MCQVFNYVFGLEQLQLPLNVLIWNRRDVNFKEVNVFLKLTNSTFIFTYKGWYIIPVIK